MHAEGWLSAGRVGRAHGLDGSFYVTRPRAPLLSQGAPLRIANGSGTNVSAVNQLVKQFGQMRKVMKQVSRGKMPDLAAMMRQGR